MLDTLETDTTVPGSRSIDAIPAAAGIGLRAAHYDDFLAMAPEVAWVEVHSENLFAAGGKVHRVMEQVRRDYPLSLHGVGLSLGSADPLNLDHLRQLKRRCAFSSSV